MKTIEQIYEPYNFSSTRCYVFVLDVMTSAYKKIDHKLPGHIRTLKGIYVSASGNYDIKKQMAGRISLNFNGQSIKCFHAAVYKTITLNDCSHPLPLDEQIIPNSFVQGYFISNNLIEEQFPFTISIYLHYKP